MERKTTLIGLWVLLMLAGCDRVVIVTDPLPGEGPDTFRWRCVGPARHGLGGRPQFGLGLRPGW